MRDPVETGLELERKAARMDFFQVLRLIENAHPELPRIGASLRPRDDAVRFGQDPSLTFHPGALGQFLRAGSGGGPGEQAQRRACLLYTSPSPRD